MNHTKMHFDRVSGVYSHLSKHGLWNILRKLEASVIVKRLPKATKMTSALDLGCGAGYYSEIMRGHGIENITCVDFSKKMLEQIKNSQFIKINEDIEKFKSINKFDIIVCAGAIEFLNDPQILFKNVSNILNANAIFILLYPMNNIFGKIYQYYHRRHGLAIRLYSEQDLVLYAKNSGLKMINACYSSPFSKVIKFA